MEKFNFRKVFFLTTSEQSTGHVDLTSQIPKERQS